MPNPIFSFFTRKKPSSSSSKPLKDFYDEWFTTLKTTLLPLLHQSLYSSSPTLLSSHVDILLDHILSYYTSLDLTAVNHRQTAVAHLLFPSYRNSIEKPFLFLGDLHPYLFTNLLRAFLEDSDDDDCDMGFHVKVEKERIFDMGYGSKGEKGRFFDMGYGLKLEKESLFDEPWQVVMAWKDPPKNLTGRIEQIECGLRLMVPALVNRLRKVQGDFVVMVAEEWVKCEGKKERFEIKDVLDREMEELTSVFTDANRLRKSVIQEIVSSLSVYQAALFLQGLAQILVGFRDQELVNEFEKCKQPVSSTTSERSAQDPGIV
ncbi:hypothetical protein ACFE04_013086 [Oxalis oulophora]